MNPERARRTATHALLATGLIAAPGLTASGPAAAQECSHDRSAKLETDSPPWDC